MSLISYLMTDLTGSSSANSQVTQAMQRLAEKNAGKAVTTTAAQSSQSSVLITIEAKRAAATKADAGTDAATLAMQLRAELDAQYDAAGEKNAADLTTLSGRALATISLNDAGQFSRAEIAAAKLELRARDRQTALGAIASGPLTAASLASYQQDLLSARSEMSAEEQRLREGNPKLR